MGSPLSLGDVYIIAKLAYRLGHAFTNGRRSAPAEVSEVEDLLYSLGSLLKSIDASGADSQVSVPSSGALQAILQSCKSTLEHLDSLVSKYGVIDSRNQSQDGRPREPVFRRWKSEAKKTWKQIWWTTEGGDLAALRSKLAMHANSLSLALGIIMKYVSLIVSLTRASV